MRKGPLQVASHPIITISHTKRNAYIKIYGPTTVMKAKLIRLYASGCCLTMILNDGCDRKHILNHISKLEQDFIRWLYVLLIMAVCITGKRGRDTCRIVKEQVYLLLSFDLRCSICSCRYWHSSIQFIRIITTFLLEVFMAVVNIRNLLLLGT